MKTLQIDERKAMQLYKTASDEFKTTLECTFGKEFFSRSITDRVKTYENACVELGEEPVDFTKQNGMLVQNNFKPLLHREIAYIKLCTIIKSLNEGWKPNWDDSDEKKYYPSFLMSPSSFAFNVSRYGCSGAIAGGGSRLCFKSKELSSYCGVQFLGLWKDLQLG